MNTWLKFSIEYANQRSYLDDLFSVYPTIPEGIREVDADIWNAVSNAFNKKNNKALVSELLKLELFPIKDSYVAYLKKDKAAIGRNPETINRLCGRIYELGLEKLFERCEQPKETNRQIGPMFKNWLNRQCLGIKPVGIDEFVSNDKNAVLDAGDKTAMEFARTKLNYNRDKGLDLVARFNGKYVIGEAMFINDYGGYQDWYLEDAIKSIETQNVKAEKIIILDGCLCSHNYNKMYEEISKVCSDYNIMSVLVLREYLYQL